MTSPVLMWVQVSTGNPDSLLRPGPHWVKESAWLLGWYKYFRAERAQKGLADLVLEHWQALPGSSHPDNTTFPKPLPDTAGGPLANPQTLRCRHSTGVLGFGLRWTPGQACLLRTDRKGSCLLPNTGDPWSRGTRGMASTEQHDRAGSASGVLRP